MGADREGGARRTPGRAVAYAACGAVLLAGCASMPDSGDLRGVESTPRQDTQVRVFAMPPHEDASSSEIVSGFLEALTSDDPDYEIARKYLTKEASDKWRPLLSTTVLADGPGAEAERAGGRDETDNLSYTLSGTKVATVDAQQSYAPASGDYSEPMHLTRDKKTRQWRIDVPPRGVVMGKSDFQRNYMSVDKYYFATNTTLGTFPHTAAVADPVYVRRNVDPMTQMVRSLLAGPTSWLNPVVRSSFPTGAALKDSGTSLTPNDQNILTVSLNDKAARVGLAQCNEMAAQLLFTLQNLTPTVDEVELKAGGRQLCELTENLAEDVATRGSVERADYLYFLDAKHHLVRLAAATHDTKPDPVPGALGEGDTQLGSVAVSRDEDMAAGVGRDGKELYVGALVSGEPLGEPELTSAGPTADERLSAPSWDAEGDLWVADRDPDNPRLLLLKDGGGDPLVVKTPPGLEGRIESVRVAADGVRIALVVERGDKSSLLIGRVERSEDGKAGERSAVSVHELRSATPQLEEVTAMSWAGDSRLVVVGREQGGVQTMRYVQVDGSTPEGPAPEALSGVKEITASEDARLPLVGYSEDGIVRLPSGTQWEKVVTDGTAPVYPG
ncbi:MULTISPECIES: LpqB family beta-propeller domain-containing protein [unclassified Streptomyces]|uniref:LpqB family beta-propeller domain-containing protein n=1 Tax=unclassified Streptomyces TaxID=2593676 RepID=UPI002365FB2C|nr:MULTISPECIES: LpqB family beta-propeller domain-containing protein [unclassified Streptomyces]MDF3143705.1 LpqB family beta-propeller domain-containing protein [Streptomyces sp. T21Q-yed]WDF44656.1 LpqB family beta-propeller domain-containing protein [Streptomyces sp. T12]